MVSLSLVDPALGAV
jgi:hypothetical protein